MENNNFKTRITYPQKLNMSNCEFHGNIYLHRIFEKFQLFAQNNIHILPMATTE